MPRFSLRALLVFVLVVAVACGVIFIYPKWLSIGVLYVGALSLPGPLIIAVLSNQPAAKSFALGGLAAYVLWFVLEGLPHFFGQYGMLVHFLGVIEMPDVLPLLVPYLAVSASGLGSLFVHRLLTGWRSKTVDSGTGH